MLLPFAWHRDCLTCFVSEVILWRNSLPWKKKELLFVSQQRQISLYSHAEFQSHTQRSSRKTGHFWPFDSKSLYKIQHCLELYIQKVLENQERWVTYQHSLGRARFTKYIQIFDCVYSALPQCFFLFRFKNHYCIELYIWKPLKNEKRLVAHHYSLREARFPKYRFLNLHIPHFRSFIPYLGWNHRCIKLSIWKALKKWKRLVASRYSLQSPCFAKYRFLNLHILHFPCFIPCLGYQTEELDYCDTGYVHFSTGLFILFRFVSQNTVSLLE